MLRTIFGGLFMTSCRQRTLRHFFVAEDKQFLVGKTLWSADLRQVTAADSSIFRWQAAMIDWFRTRKPSKVFLPLLRNSSLDSPVVVLRNRAHLNLVLLATLAADQRH
jgi:hypothetical protein